MPVKPKGKLIIIGGAEDKNSDSIPEIAASEEDFERYDILDELKTSRKNAVIELISVGSELPEASRKNYTKVFKKAGYHTVGLINVAHRREVDTPAYLERIERAQSIFFCGGRNLDGPGNEKVKPLPFRTGLSYKEQKVRQCSRQLIYTKRIYI